MKYSTIIRPILILLNSVLMALSVNATSYREIPDTSNIMGEVTFESKNDTLYLTYHLTPKNFNPDSVIFTIDGHGWNYEESTFKIDVNDYVDTLNSFIIYRSGEDLPFQNSWRSAYKKNGKLYLDGAIRVPIDGQSTAFWQCTA